MKPNVGDDEGSQRGVGRGRNGRGRAALKMPCPTLRKKEEKTKKKTLLPPRENLLPIINDPCCQGKVAEDKW